LKSSELIPQREPFVLVDEIIECSGERTLTRFSFDDTHILCRNGLLLEAGIIENFAQSAAAGAGYHFVLQGLDIPIGFIGSVDKLKINFRPSAGDLVETEITVAHRVMNVTVVDCVSKVKENVVATCKMKIFIIDQEQ
jgi:3-hydroxymyristoyl/3-hydroxydecanoyl-(acyl carrier protein) dehydratase